MVQFSIFNEFEVKRPIKGYLTIDVVLRDDTRIVRCESQLWAYNTQ